MKTKNILYALFASLTLCVSCSDDEDKPRTSLEFPQGTESSVNLSYDQDEFSIPFITEEEWTASVITEESTWIRIPVEKGIGNHELKVLVDPNTSRDRRSGQIEISNGIQTLSYTVSQGTLFEGNDENTEINYAAFGKRNVPLGFGIRVKKSSKKDLLPTKQIMDFVHWEKLNDADKRLAKMTSEEYLGQAKVPDTKIVLTTAKDYAAPSQSINATLKVTIGFGLSKIGLDGGFSLNRKSTDESYAYRAATTVPFWVYGVDDYDGYMKSATALDPNNEKQREIRDQVLGGDFADLYDQMVRCFGNGGTVQMRKV